MNKKTRFKLILFLIIASVILFIIGISLALIFIPGVREASLGEKECKYVSNPYFATISCKPGDAGTNIGEKDILQEGQWLDRPKDVAQYTIYLKGGRRVITGIIYFEYYICSSYNLGDCKIHKSIKLSQDSEQITLPDLSGNDYIWIQFQKVTIFGTSGLSGAKYDISYIPFVLWREDRLKGGEQKITKQTCEIDRTGIEWVASIKDSEIGLKESSDYRLKPYETFNYISSFVVVPAPIFADYNGQKVYCQYHRIKARCDYHEQQVLLFHQQMYFSRVFPN